MHTRANKATEVNQAQYHIIYYIKTTKANTNLSNSVNILISEQNCKQRVVILGIRSIYKWKQQNQLLIVFHTYSLRTRFHNVVQIHVYHLPNKFIRMNHLKL